MPRSSASIATQASAAPAVAVKVFSIASAAPPPADSAEPALKPNQPTNRIAAPTKLSGSECGAISSRPSPMRGPITQAPTSAAMPALICTTVPPAKSIAPQPANRPAGAQAMWAMGK